MTNTKIPTLLVLLFLVCTVITSLFALHESRVFKSGAASSYNPIDLKITNIKDTSFTVSWVTDVPTIGIVQYKNAQGDASQSDASLITTTHFVTLQNLSPNTVYSFAINSSGQIFDNQGSDWITQTLTTQMPQVGEIISGKVLYQNNLPAKNSLVYASAPTGQIFSTQVTQSGNWIISLPPIEATAIIQILIESGSSLTSTAKANLTSANPLPTMILGKNYNFSIENKEPALEIPKVQIQLP